MNPQKFIGRCVQQVEEYNETIIQPLLAKEKELLGMHADIQV